MRLHVVHETHYRYASPVALSQQLLHLSPRVLPWQSCELHRVQIDPFSTELAEREDYFGNRIVQFIVAAAHRNLLVRAESEVVIQPRAHAALARPKAAWETVRAQLNAIDKPPVAEVTEFAFESPHVERSKDLADYAVKSFTARRGILEAATDLAKRIHKDFKFDRTATSVSTPLREVMKNRRGVCQDFAHLMIGCLRSIGLAARYVSGYILTAPPPGRPRLIGADASHAWVSLWCGKAGPDEAGGWVDIDPTNNCIVDDFHATLGWGRDFGDVTPMRGVILGGGDQQLAVRVTVTPKVEATLESR